MLKRVITGAFIFIFTELFVFLRHFSVLFFDAFALVISYGCLFELIKANKNADKKVWIVPLLFVPALLCVAFIFESSWARLFAYFLLIALLVLLISLLCDICVMAKKRKNGEIETDESKLNSSLFEKTKNTMQVLAYPLLPLSALFLINHLGYNLGFVGLILVFAVSMLTDTMAYFVGRAFGKRKLVPEVSPKKTVAGMIGGFVGGIVGAAACFCTFYFAGLFGVTEFPLSLSISAFAVIGVLGSLATQLGDLVESAFKRKAGIKDSSNIFPGHGGFLDRVDGLMFNSVLVAVTILIFLV